MPKRKQDPDRVVAVIDGAMVTEKELVKSPEVITGLPPLPVFDDHLKALLNGMDQFTCNGLEDFERAKAWDPQATGLIRQIEDSFRPRKQAFDKAKQPTLDVEAGYITRIKLVLGNVRAFCASWQREEKRKADLEADRIRQEEIRRREEEKQHRADILREFGEPEAAKEVEAAEVIPPRFTAPEVPTYARGVRTALKLKATITDPGKVQRLYCVPSPSLINAKVHTFTSFNKKPTDEQVKALADEIGGVHLEWE